MKYPKVFKVALNTKSSINLYDTGEKCTCSIVILLLILIDNNVIVLLITTFKVLDKNNTEN